MFGAGLFLNEQIRIIVFFNYITIIIIIIGSELSNFITAVGLDPY